MRGRSNLSPEAAALELIPADYSTPLDVIEIFGRAAPLEIDLGAGDGTLLEALATERSNRNFIGVERLFGRCRSACRKLASAGLTNARVLRAEISHVLEHMLPESSVTSFYLMFPDPWPKRRHQTRRVVTQDFLRAIHRTLVDGGTLRIATDQSDYFRQIDRAAGASDNFEIEKSDGGGGLPLTSFEARFQNAGVEIHRVLLRKVSSIK